MWVTPEEFKGMSASSLLRMPTTRAPEFDAPFEGLLRGSVVAGDIPAGFVVEAVGHVIDNEPGLVDPLGAALTLEHVDVWEHILTFRAYHQGFKASYSS